MQVTEIECEAEAAGDDESEWEVEWEYLKAKEDGMVLNPRFAPEYNKCIEELTNCQSHIGLLIAYPMSFNSNPSMIREDKNGKRYVKVCCKSNAAEMFTGNHLKFLDYLFKMHQEKDEKWS